MHLRDEGKANSLECTPNQLYTWRWCYLTTIWLRCTLAGWWLHDHNTVDRHTALVALGSSRGHQFREPQRTQGIYAALACASPCTLQGCFLLRQGIVRRDKLRGMRPTGEHVHGESDQNSRVAFSAALDSVSAVKVATD